MGQLHRLFGKSSPAHQSELIEAVAALIGVEGLGGLILRFAASGLGPQVESWIQPGPNQKIAPRQVRAAVGMEEVERIAADANLPTRQVEQGLANILPRAVDRLTPDGTVPPSANIRRSLGRLDGLLEAS